MAKKKSEGVGGDTQDELAESLMAAINKTSKTGKLGVFIGKEDSPSDLKDPISSGSSLLDLAVSGIPNGGVLYSSRILELNGLEGSAKSLICAHMIKDVQQKGGLAVLIDSENAVNEVFFRSVGGDMDKLCYFSLYTIEEIFETIEKMIVHVRAADKNRNILIVVDSLAGASTLAELEAGYTREGWATGKSIILSMAMRKITGILGSQRVALVFTNQLRQKLGAAQWGDQFTTSGGRSVAYHSSARIRLAAMGKIQDKDKNVLGVNIKATVIKNRFGPPFKSVVFDVLFSQGIDDEGSWLKFLKDKDILQTAGAYTKYTRDNGDELKFQSKEWKPLLVSTPGLRDEIYQKICTTMNASTSTTNLTPEEMSLVTEDD